MNENLKAFFRKASEDDELKSRLADAVGQGIEAGNEAIVAIAREAGFDVGIDDMRELQDMSEELDEEELAQVSAAGSSGGGIAPGTYTKTPCTCYTYGSGRKSAWKTSWKVLPCECYIYGEGHDSPYYDTEENPCYGDLDCTCFHVGVGKATIPVPRP